MKTTEMNLDFAWHFTILALIAATYLLLPDLYAAGPGDPQDSGVGNYICTVAEYLGGNAGRGIATIGISVIGILALVGRITWTQVLIVGVGCSVLFGAYKIAIGFGSLGTGTASSVC